MIALLMFVQMLQRAAQLESGKPGSAREPWDVGGFVGGGVPGDY